MRYRRCVYRREPRENNTGSPGRNTPAEAHRPWRESPRNDGSGLQRLHRGPKPGTQTLHSVPRARPPRSRDNAACGGGVAEPSRPVCAAHTALCVTRGFRRRGQNCGRGHRQRWPGCNTTAYTHTHTHIYI